MYPYNREHLNSFLKGFQLYFDAHRYELEVFAKSISLANKIDSLIL
jgi:hypothetical protein